MGILTEDMKRVISQNRLGFYATVCPDGTPNLSPKGTTMIYDDDHLGFVNLGSPTTLSNLAANPSIEISMVDLFIRKGYRFKGTATIVTEGPIFDGIRDSYKGSSVQPLIDNVKAAVLIKIDRALPLISPAYLPGVTEEETRAQWEQHWGQVTNDYHAETAKQS
ncbi:MAG TPA: pyridoxamine 5'-phosphate oxidase family protein [Dehalococcoidia bacterium]|nr:pyridoxamine 5'-phosphate oxidase family protein [Dehalococcoidia bacterium]